MADNEHVPGIIETAITPQVDAINSAQYGAEVRSSIATAFTTIAQKCDEQVSEVIDAASVSSAAMEAAAQQYTRYMEEASVKVTQLEGLGAQVENLNSAIQRIRTIETETVPYNEFTRIDGTKEYSLPSNVPSVGFVGETVDNEGNPLWSNWKFRTPVPPAFTNMKVQHLLYQDYQNNPTAYKDSISYNPNTGDFLLKIKDDISRMTVSVYEENQNITGTFPSKFEYINLGDGTIAPHLTIGIPRGRDGTGSAEAVRYRPFIHVLKTFDASSYANGAYFSPQSVVSKQHTISQTSEKIVDVGAEDFDLAIIVLRKTCNNNDTAKMILNQNFYKPTTKFLVDNDDFDSTVAVILPKGGDVTASMIDNQGRMFMRRIHWARQNDPFFEVASGGSKSRFPTYVRFMSQSALTQNPTAGYKCKNTNGTVIKYENAFVFEHAVYGKKYANEIGDNSEYTFWDTGDYRKGRKQSGYKDPSNNIEMNKIYDQCLIPIQIIGISFTMSASDVGMFFAEA